MSLRNRVNRAIDRFFSPRTSSKVALRDMLSYLVEAIETAKLKTVAVRVYRINESLPLPARANASDAGFDIYAAENVTFKPGETKLVPLGIIAEAPPGFHFKLYLRSSMSLKRSFTLGNGVGIIDSSYAGPNDMLCAIIHYQSVSKTEGKIKKGERVGQLILAENIDIVWKEQTERSFAGKNRGGFGSTGK